MTNRQAAIKIVKQLRSEGFEALLAGGCVRDMLLGRDAKDYDVATSARPKEIIRLFRRTIKVGAKFGVIIVLTDARQVEVATFRTEADYADGRHPGTVVFSSAAEDAKRRDFTINGMFYDPIEKKIIDFVRGRADIENGIIRTIGSARQRFSEDYLRMLRAVRFSAQLGFEIEAKTASAIRSNAAWITNISGERIAMELEGILTNPNRLRGAGLLCKSTLAEVIFPLLADKQLTDFGISVLGHLPKMIDFPLALAGLFSGADCSAAVNECKMLKLSRNRMRHFKFLLKNRGVLLDEDMSLARLKTIAAEAYFGDLQKLQKAIQKAGGRSISALNVISRRLKALKGVELKPKPLLNGHELIRLGAVAGPQVGLLGQELYIEQLCERVNSAGEAEIWVRNWLDRHKKLGD